MTTSLDANLLQDPGAEQAVPAGYDDVVPIPGWTTTANMTVDAYTTPGGDLVPGDAPPFGGYNYFYGGPNNGSTATSQASQVVAFGDLSSDVNGGAVTATISGYLGGYGPQNDHMDIIVAFLDADGATVGTAELDGPESFPNGSGLTFETMSVVVPVNTVAVDYTILATREQGSDNDGLADNLSFSLDDAASPPCYCPGTMILTDRGEIAVEALAVGDRVVTAFGRTVPIRWIGRRSYGARFLLGRSGLMPVRIRAGALGGGLPRRDLVVSPEHAMFIDDVLVPARHLVDGVTIVWERGRERIDYFHVELDVHDILVADGAASESFYDDDSRQLFQNAGEYAALYGAVTAPSGFCARRVESGFELEAIRQRLRCVASIAAAA